MMQEPCIGITGIGCVCSLGADFAACMENLFTGEAYLGSPADLGLKLPENLVLRSVDDSRVSSAEHLLERGRAAQLAVVAARDALQGFAPGYLAGKRVGVCIGTTVGNTLNNLQMYAGYRQGRVVDMTEINRYFASNPAEVVAAEFDCRGPRFTVANACSSGADAVGIALSWLRAGVCDVVLAGGCDELSPVSIAGFQSLMIAAAGPCRPFDRNRQGLNLGEGAAILVLERVDGAKPGCSIAGYGTACDAYHVTAPHPQGLGLKMAIGQAMSPAGVEADDLAFVNAHGTGTLDNDRVEMQVLAEMLPDVPYFSVKGVTGHTLGAAGAIEAALTCGCLQQGKIPASHGFSQLPENTGNGPVSFPHAIRKPLAISQSLAFGGNNSVLLVRHNA